MTTWIEACFMDVVGERFGWSFLFIDIDGVAVPESSVTFIDNGLPEEKEGVYIIVSKLTADAFPLRDDLLLVNEMVRDENGAIIGCRSLAQANKKYKFKNYN